MNQPDGHPNFKTNKALLFGHLPFSIQLNEAATLIGTKEEIKKRLKDQIQNFANSYVALATFVTDEEMEIVESVKKSLKEINADDEQSLEKWLENPVNRENHDKALNIYNRVLKEIKELRSEIEKIEFV